MITRRITSAATAFALLLASSLLHAQGTAVGKTLDRSDIQVVSSFVSAGEVVPGTCREEAAIFARTLVRYPMPSSWHWVLICDEAGWQRFLRQSGRNGGDPIYASTDLSARTSFLRGERLLQPDPGAQPEEVISHELAHIYLNSGEEVRAESLARWWRRQAETQPQGTARVRKSTLN